MSGLALVASLDINPFSYATTELNADTNSASQYYFLFYHYLVDGSELEYFGTTQRDTFYQ